MVQAVSKTGPKYIHALKTTKVVKYSKIASQFHKQLQRKYICFWKLYVLFKSLEINFYSRLELFVCMLIKLK